MENPESDQMLLDLMEERFNQFKKMTPKKKMRFWDETATTLGTTADNARVKWNSRVNSLKRRKINGPVG